MRRLLPLLLFLAPLAARADTAFGAWTGSIQLPNGVALRIDVKLDDAHKGTIDIPEQGAAGLPLSKINVSGDGVAFTLSLPSGDATFDGKRSGDSITGTFTQAGHALPFTLTRGAPPSPPPLPRLLAKDAPGLVGRWTGQIGDPPAPVPIELDVRADGEGLAGALDVPRQCLTNQRVVQVARAADGRVHIEVKAPFGIAAFDGKLDKDTLAGDYHQPGHDGKFTLARAAARPEPAPPPYVEEKVTYASGAIQLAATLTRPKAAAKAPAVVLLTGSGPQDRDECVLGVRPFAAIADALTRAGWAVLRTDDRGVGESKGNFAAATPPDFAADARAGLAYLRSRPEIDGARVGLLGHSEGGIIAPMVAAEDRSVAFVVILAGPGQRLDEIILAQQALIDRAEGEDDKLIAAESTMTKALFATVRKEKNIDKLRATFKGLAQKHLPAAAVAKAGGIDALVTAELALFNSDWFRWYLTYDPAATLAKVRCPLLALNGSLDLQVPAKANLAVIRAAAAKGKNKRVRTVELTGLNHLFQKAKTGSPTEYADLGPPDAALTATIVEWLGALAQ